MPRPSGSLLAALSVLGPGLAVAATGVGAGDVVAATVAGAQYGVVILWAAVAGAVVKGALNEGIARWQLATGTTLLEGWGVHLHRALLIGFAVYLVLWTFMVAGALMAACGLAAHALLPQLSVAMWGVLHSVVAAVLVLVGRYTLFERLMKGFIALMFVTVVGSAVLVRPDLGALLAGLARPAVPEGAGPFLLGVIGGVGGSVTLLSYSYWIRERGWTDAVAIRAARLDLGVAYALTGLFGVAISGPLGRGVFLVGFWGAVFTSMLGVWQGVPYIFADVVRTLRRGARPASVSTTSPTYRGYLLYLAVVPMVLLLADRPVWIVVLYSIAGAFFMPFLAGTLLWLNNRRTTLRELANGWLANTLLVAALLVFGYLCVQDLLDRFG